MTADQKQQRYTAVAIALHWLIAIGIVGMIALGWYMNDLPRGDSGKFALIQLHKSIGISLLTAAVARVIWRLMNPPPVEPAMPPLQALIAKLVHAGLYVLIIAMPLTGWIMVSAAPAGVATVLFQTLPWPHLPGLANLSHDAKQQLKGPLEFVHSKLAWVIIGFLALHLAGALKHQLLDKDNLLVRMAPGLFGSTAGPPRRSQGALFAFGGTAALFIAAVAVASFSGAPSRAEPTPPATHQASSAPHWRVDPQQSSIAFKGAYMGRPFQGKFGAWTSEIQFDPDKPADARIRVVVKTASAVTGEAYFDDNLKEGDWFDARTSPDAVFEVNEGVLKDGPTTFEATGLLNLKGVVYPVRLPFTLEIKGAVAKVHAQTSLKRLALGIGKGTAAAANGDQEWVQDDVALVVDVTATRE